MENLSDNYCILFHKWKHIKTFYRTVYPYAKIQSYKCTKYGMVKHKEKSVTKDKIPY
jgi:hypothetical protein